MNNDNDKPAILKRIADLSIQLPGGQAGIAFEYFLERPNLDVHHDDVVPWIEECLSIRVPIVYPIFN